jgi:hypothetical protein
MKPRWASRNCAPVANQPAGTVNDWDADQLLPPSVDVAKPTPLAQAMSGYEAI